MLWRAFAGEPLLSSSQFTFGFPGFFFSKVRPTCYEIEFKLIFYNKSKDLRSYLMNFISVLTFV